MKDFVCGVLGQSVSAAAGVSNGRQSSTQPSSSRCRAKPQSSGPLAARKRWTPIVEIDHPECWDPRES